MIQPTVIPANLGNEFDLGIIEPNKIHIKTDEATVVRNPLTGEISSVPFAFAIPQPKIEILQGSLNKAPDMDGNGIFSESFIMARLDDVPKTFFSPLYRVKLELLRIKASGRKRTSTGTQRRGRRFVHPTNVVNGVATHGHIAGTRGGGQTHPRAFTRVTEWDVTPQAFFDGIKIPVSEAMGSYFFRTRYSDKVNTITAYAYADGQKNRHVYHAREGIQYAGRQAGLFAFRYAIYNPFSARYEQGALSQVIWVASKRFPTYLHEEVNSLPATTHSYTRRVNVKADNTNEIIAKFQQ